MEIRKFYFFVLFLLSYWHFIYLDDDLIIDNSQIISHKTYDDSLGRLWSTLYVKLHFRRKSLFYSFNFIIPRLGFMFISAEI